MCSGQGKELMVLRFATENSDNMNWFSESNLREAPWEGILTATKNNFSLEGPCFLGKCCDFHINNYYKLCSTDRGWLSVGDARVCNWENRFLENAFIFSNRATMVKYNQFGK